MSGGLLILMHGIFSFRHWKPIRLPSQTNQTDSLPNTQQSYLFQKIEAVLPHTAQCSLSDLSSNGAGTSASSTWSLFFFLASPNKITHWSGAALGSFQISSDLMELASICMLPAPTLGHGNSSGNPGNEWWNEFNLNSVYYKRCYYVSLKT